jgi:hypothetical protein
MGGKRKVDAPIQICALHSNFDAKLDTILANQTAYIADIQRLKDKVENGLSSQVSDTCSHVAIIKDKLVTLEQSLESFSWFRTWVTSMRDGLFKNVMKLAFGLTIIWFILQFGKQSIAALIKAMGG